MPTLSFSITLLLTLSYRSYFMDARVEQLGGNSSGSINSEMLSKNGHDEYSNRRHLRRRGSGDELMGMT